MSKLSEKKLQAKSVLWFSQEFPERRGDYFSTFQETINEAQGSNMLSLGLIGGVPDTFLIRDGIFTGIEWKAEETYHDLIHILEQCRFLINNCSTGWFCTSLDMFQGIVNDTGIGIVPTDIVDECFSKIGTKVNLSGCESIDDLIFEANKWQKKTGKKMSKVKF